MNSSWHTSQLTYALGFGGMMSFYGIVMVLVYMMPSPWATFDQRIVIIVFVLLTLPFVLLIGFFVSRRAKKKERQAEAAAAAPAPEQVTAQAGNGSSAAGKLNAPAGTYGDLTTGAEEVVQFLKTSNMGGGKDAVYSLPWYLVAGAPTAGKSALVINSNLNFQALPSQRQSELLSVRPTRSVDWRVTSEGVFVDTTGRYQTEGADADEWASLLETIRKYRGNRPLDGFLMIVNTKEILAADERQIEERAKVLRARLDEAMQRLKVRFPVYLIFTNADSIEGFGDSFSASKEEDKTLVWGATIPLDKSENAQAQFDSEFELLHDSVTKRRLVRLSAPFPPVRQLRIFNFPLHFGTARKKFGTFVNALFRPSPFSENPLLRGFYFTASPQLRSKGAQAGSGHPFFTERLFRDVILRDRDLVKTFQAQRQRPPIFGCFFTVLMAFVVTILLILSGVSLYQNKQMLDEAKDRGDKIITIFKADAGKPVLGKNEQETRREINATEDMRQLLDRMDDYERNGAPLYMRMGLYSGNRIYKEQLLPNYMSLVEQRFKKPTIARVEAELKKFIASPPVANPGRLTDKEEDYLGKNYDLLKAYLMLSGGEFKDSSGKTHTYKQKAEPTHIANTLREYWVSEAKIPADLNLVAEQQLDFWAKQVDRDDNQYRFPRIEPDMKLVSDARAKLQSFPAPNRYYKRKVTEISKQVDDKLGKMSVDGILSRGGADDPSLLDGNYVVPGAFTKPGYELMKTAISEADQKLSEDDWVMGESGKQAIAQSTDASKVQEMYYRDYADHWRNFIKAINVRPFKNKDDAAAALGSFSSANSPMKVLLVEVAKDTNLSAQTGNGWWLWIKSWFVTSSSSDTGGDTQPEKEFRPLFTFVTGKDKVPIDTYQTIFATALKQFNLKVPTNDKLQEVTQAMGKDDDPLKLRDRENDIQGLTSAFKETPSGQELITLLMKPIGAVRDLFGQGIKAQLQKTWNDQLLPAAKELEKGYPFADGQTEVDLSKVSAYLNPVDGQFSQFYNGSLKKYFDEANGQVKPKQGAGIQFTDEFVAYVNNALAVQKGLYGTSQTPKFEYEFALKGAQNTLIDITIDGQKATADGTGSIKGTFPATGTDTGVFINLGSSGVTTTSGPSAPNSNTAAKPASTGSADSKKYPGTWGLFRFVDDSHPQKQSTGEYSLSFSVGGKSVSATIKPSGGDLFDKTVFRSMKSPGTFLK
jgi:type VI secretion system protein ImpL